MLLIPTTYIFSPPNYRPTPASNASKVCTSVGIAALFAGISGISFAMGHALGNKRNPFARPNEKAIEEFNVTILVSSALVGTGALFLGLSKLIPAIAARISNAAPQRFDV